MRLIIALLFTFVFTGANAQETKLCQPDLLLTINPISLIDPFGPTALRIGLDRSLLPNFTIGLELCGFYNYYPESFDPDKLQGAAWRLSAIRWYTRRPDEVVGFEVGVSYKQTGGMVSDTIRLDGIPPYDLAYHLDRRIFITRLSFVHRSNWAKRYWLEYYYGIGVRFKDATCTGISPEELDARSSGSDPNDPGLILPYKHACGKIVQPDLVLGLRIGLGLK
jgi:hypothetical protein